MLQAIVQTAESHVALGALNNNVVVGVLGLPLS